jgi:hypothetical protein
VPLIALWDQLTGVPVSGTSRQIDHPSQVVEVFVA